MKTKLFNQLEDVISGLAISRIAKERKMVLQPLIDFIQDKANQNSSVLLNFICTHNSRRSHLSQIWAQAMSAYFGIKNVSCYSGGTEATAMFPMIAEILKNSGFEIAKEANKDNPIYSIRYSENEKSIKGFSKTYDNEFNPKSEFAAIMTCSHADENCPFIPGAEKRIPITYEDPKAFDNTPKQAEKYQERSLQIATEMYYVFSMIR